MLNSSHFIYTGINMSHCMSKMNFMENCKMDCLLIIETVSRNVEMIANQEELKSFYAKDEFL